MGRKSAWQWLAEAFLRENDPDDEELDAMTSPVRANPFEPPARVDVSKVDPQKTAPSAGQMRKPQHPQATVTGHVSNVNPTPGQNKPAYRGKFVGQTVDMGGRYQGRRVGFEKNTGLRGIPDKGRGTVYQKSHDTFVWDGGNWITPEEFEQKFKKRR